MEYVYNAFATAAIKDEILNGRAVTIAYHADQAMAPEAQLNDYLMTKYDVAFDQHAAAPFVMENDKLMYVTDNESSQMTDEVHLDDFALGITPVQMLSQAGKLNLEIEMPDYDEIPLPSDAADAVEDGRVYNMTDYSFYYKLKDCDTYVSFLPTRSQLKELNNF